LGSVTSVERANPPARPLAWCSVTAPAAQIWLIWPAQSLAYLDSDGAARCGLPAEVEARSTMESIDGPLESTNIRCPLGHWFNGPIESLTRHLVADKVLGSGQIVSQAIVTFYDRSLMAGRRSAGPWLQVNSGSSCSLSAVGPGPLVSAGAL
jgi:hypothetical protein